MRNQLGDTVYNLRTQSGNTVVVWGRAPGMHVPGEPTTKEKLAYMDKEIEKYGTLEGPKGFRREIDIPSEIQNRRTGLPK